MKTSKSISVSATSSALHRWMNAPDTRYYLRYPHMHNFHITVTARVNHGDREIEFHDLRDRLKGVLNQLIKPDQYGVPTFGGSSCEHVGESILELMPEVDQVRVAEDETVSALVTRLPNMPHIVTVCGSTKFKEETIKTVETLTQEGHMVFSVGFFGHADKIPYEPGVKEALDALHLHKIDASDWIYVVNVGGYIGESTMKEIEHARKRQIPVLFMEDPRSESVISNG